MRDPHGRFPRNPDVRTTQVVIKEHRDCAERFLHPKRRAHVTRQNSCVWRVVERTRSSSRYSAVGDSPETMSSALSSAEVRFFGCTAPRSCEPVTLLWTTENKSGCDKDRKRCESNIGRREPRHPLAPRAMPAAPLLPPAARPQPVRHRRWHAPPWAQAVGRPVN